ncbi:homoserine O-acetyltransferase [Arcticibacter tournemirensis]|uniref:Homoserine O-acetyltransferase n=1 Tax=Arcticibacter tournemirensis TaxID=699437 RepID=A0A5M9GUW1_9SPHI|nr:homoserine O-acetyltransferase [Arcticibacter tournemirensis]KAA8478503.1 homoserine O-acetyltransferase [Arcticibacter tournemirensis]TQM51150.1 homoserine O-acetyltransferase [Arcticibacter tournemirensis]
MNIKKYTHNKTFKLEDGSVLPDLEIAYQTYGRLNDKRDNVIWVCHALTANSDVLDWWKGLFGENDLFNPKDHYIVCANILGSHYGTTNPLSENPQTGSPYYMSFPKFNTRDLAAVQRILADYLDIEEISVLIGGSLGGQQAMEWAIAEPDRIKRLILIATNAVHSPWGVAFNESQRLAISADPTFHSNHPDGGKNGLKAARSIALLSYRNYDTYGISQQEVSNDKTDDFKASSYQNYQGEKLVKRFNAYSYWYLSKAMDSHNVGRGRGLADEVLKKIKAVTLVIGITSDLLFPPAEQRFLAEHIPDASYTEISSFYGHDGFLIETEILTKEIGSFLKRTAYGSHIVTLHKIA